MHYMYNTSTLDFPNCLGDSFAMLMKPLPACNALNHFSVPFWQLAVAIHIHSLDSPRVFCTVLCCKKRLSNSILKAFYQVASHLVVVVK